MLTLFQFGGLNDLSSLSPYCLKLETSFRIFDVPYDLKVRKDLKGAPKGKMPFVHYKGEVIGDSELIIKRLQADGLLPKHQNPGDLAYIRLLDKHLTTAIVYSRWLDDANFDLLKEMFFGSLPPIVRSLVPKLVRRQVTAQLRGHGMGRHTPREMAEMAEADIACLAERLGGSAYFGGEAPGLLDAAAYGTLANIMVPEFPSPLQDAMRRHKNLTAFCDRVKHRYYVKGMKAAA